MVSILVAMAIGSLFVAGGGALNAQGQAGSHSKVTSKHVKASRKAGKDR